MLDHDGERAVRGDVEDRRLDIISLPILDPVEVASEAFDQLGAGQPVDLPVSHIGPLFRRVVEEKLGVTVEVRPPLVSVNRKQKFTVWGVRHTDNLIVHR